MLKQVRKALDGKLIDRDDVRQAIGIINEMKDEVSKGKNFVIFPEGTRSKDGNNPGPFKGGTFKSAMKAKAPIVPVALIVRLNHLILLEQVKYVFKFIT